MTSVNPVSFFRNLRFSFNSIGGGEKPMPKRYEDLPIQENFIFTKVMSDPKLLKGLLIQILPHLDLSEIQIVLKEKTVDEYPNSHSVRFDVFAKDGKHMFCVEMQVSRYYFSPRHARYYQGAADMEDLNTGQDYEDLKDQYIIFICPFDPFGTNMLVYTVTNKVHETGEEFGDDTTKIFINCTGKNSEDYPLLKPFTDYVMATMSDDAYIAEVDQSVRQARMNPLWRKQYMDLRDYKKIGKDEGLREGRIEGKKEERLNNAEKMIRYGLSFDQTAEKEEYRNSLQLTD